MSWIFFTISMQRLLNPLQFIQWTVQTWSLPRCASNIHIALETAAVEKKDLESS